MAFEAQVHHFHIADYVVFVAVLVLSLVIGLYYAFSGGKQRTVQEYLLGNRQMGIFPITMSLVASFLSAIGMISLPAELYMYGWGFIFFFFGTVIAIPVVSAFYMPTFYNLELTSVYEYLERRFDSNIRKIGSFLFIVQMAVYTTLVIYAPALALSQVTGLRLWVSVVGIGVLGTIYTAIGGIKAVMWTDVFQISVLFLALGIVTVKGVIDLGGFNYVITKAAEGQRLEPLSFSADPRIRYTVWSVIFGSTTNEIAVYGINQAQVQRYLTSPSLKEARRTIWLNLLGILYFYICIALSGLIIYAKFWNCDPLTAKLISSPDQVFPLFVMETLNMLPGLPGLFVAGVFCGSLSTFSSTVNSMAAITLEDFVRAYKKEPISSERAAFISKLLAAGYGCLCLVMVATVANMGSNIIQVNYYNKTFTGAMFGLFTLGIFFPWTNRAGAYSSLAVGLLFGVWISVQNQMNKQFTPPAPVSTDGCQEMYGNFTYTWETSTNLNSSLTPATDTESSSVFVLFQVSFVWIQVLTCCTVIIIGALVSMITGPTKLHEIDLRLLCPQLQFFIRKYYKSLVHKVATEEPLDETELYALDQKRVKLEKQ